MKPLIVTFALLSACRVCADTIQVKRVETFSPYEIKLPYFSSQENLEKEVFDASKLLDENKNIYLNEKKGNFVQLPLVWDSSANQIRRIKWTVSVSEFTPVKFNITGLQNYHLFLNAKKVSNKVELLPGKSTFDIVAFVPKDSKEKIEISIIGDNLNSIKVNSEKKQLWTQKLMLEGEHYANVSLSPSGKYLVYSIYNQVADEKRNYTTYLTETNSRKVLRKWKGYRNIEWLDHKDIYYKTENDANGFRQLIFVNPSSFSEEVIARNIPKGSFRIAPNGKYLFYSKTEEGPQDKKGVHHLYEPDDRMPGWRKRTSLFAYDLETNMMQQLTFGKENTYLNDISADGQYLLFSINTFKCDRIPFVRTSMYEMDLQSLNVDTVFYEEPFIASATYAFDSRNLLVKGSPWVFNRVGCTLKRNEIPNEFDYRLYFYKRDENRAIPLLNNFAPSIKSWVCNNKDKKIYFNADDGYDIGVFQLDVKDKVVKQIELPISDVQRWSVAYNNKHPYIVVTGQSGEIARQMLIGKPGKPFKHIGPIDFQKMMLDVALPTCHDWEFKTTRGDTIRNFYYLPNNFDRSKKYPMIVYYYGGCMPTVKGLEGFWPLSALASQGYVVLVLEPSGAIGFGQEFASRHVNTWGDRSSDDIIEGVKLFCKQHDFVNRQKIGCMGASYGGFMTEYLMTQTDIFAAAISHAGISDITGYWGGGYWGYTYGETAEYGNFPWSNPELFVKHSPLYNADKIHTPLLLLHGDSDTNVPTQQSQALFTALKILHRPVEYITFDGCDHVIRNYEQRMIWQSYINAWFAKWLKDDPTWWNYNTKR